MNNSDVAVLKRLRPKVEAQRAVGTGAEPIYITPRQLQAMKRIAERCRDRMTPEELARCRDLGILR